MDSPWFNTVMQDEAVLRAIEAKYRSLSALMDERMRRQWAAAESRAYGWGGVRAVSSAIGMSPNTIRKGLAELAARDEKPDAPVESGLRRKGAGRKKRTEADPDLLHALEILVEPTTRGDPGSALRWTCKSTTLLANELTRMHHPVSPRTVGRLLNESGYSLQSNRKTLEGASHPDRNAQFEFINASVERFQQRGQPVISVDTKKPVSGNPRANLKRSRSMTSWTPDWAKPFPMACMTSAKTKAGSVWASITTPRVSPPRPSTGGGRRWDPGAIATRVNC